MAIWTILWRSSTTRDITMRRSFYFRQWIGAVRGIGSSESHGDEVLGIDLGTTNSRVAVMEGLIPTVIESESGRATPSFVAINSEKDILAGQIAKLHAIAYPENTLFKIKNLIGRRFNDPQTQKLMSMVPYKIVEASNGDALVEVGVERFSPTQVCAFIIREMKEAAERHLMKLVSKAVITVPVHFNDVQRRETEAAGRTAGLDVLRIIDEPIAAAISSFKSMNNGVVAVLDLGGGAFDVSILEISNGVIKVIASNGDAFLGGEDFDHALVEYLVDEIRRTYSEDVSGDRVAMMRLMEAAENAKVVLSSAFCANICVQYIAATASFPIHLNITLTRSKFEEIVYDLIERARIICQNCLKDAGSLAKEIGDVILVGGMARVPRVQQIVGEIFRKAPKVVVEDSLEAVVVGAAIQGGFIIEDEKEPQLPNDVIPLSLGIETLGGVFTRIINRNTRIPTKASRTFSTESDNQKNICLRILQGEREMSTDNKLLGELVLIGIPPAPQGIPSIVLTFDIDGTGILSVTAENKDTGIESTIRVKSVIETKKYAKKVVKEAMLNGKRDQEKSNLVEVRNEAASLINKIEKFLLVKKQVIPPYVRLALEAAWTDLRLAMDSGNVLVIRSKLYAANRANIMLILSENTKSDSDVDDSEYDDDL